MGNLAALFSYRLLRMSTVEIRTGCRFWVTPCEPRPEDGGNKPLSQPETLQKWCFGQKRRVDGPIALLTPLASLIETENRKRVSEN